MATPTSSIPDSRTSRASRGGPHETQLSRAASGSIEPLTRAQRVRMRVLHHLPWVLVSCLGLSLLMRAEQHYRHWEAQSKPLAVLQAVAARQKLYFEANRAYTSALTDLRLSLPPEEQARIHLVAAPRAGRPDYLAEYCEEGQCVAMNSRGELMKPVQLQTALIPVGLPELTLKRPQLRSPSRRATNP